MTIDDLPDDRDFYAEGADAALAGGPDIPPKDVTEHGESAEALWMDGWRHIQDPDVPED